MCEIVLFYLLPFLLHSILGYSFCLPAFYLLLLTRLFFYWVGLLLVATRLDRNRLPVYSFLKTLLYSFILWTIKASLHAACTLQGNACTQHSKNFVLFFLYRHYCFIELILSELLCLHCACILVVNCPAILFSCIYVRATLVVRCNWSGQISLSSFQLGNNLLSHARVQHSLAFPHFFFFFLVSLGSHSRQSFR